MKDLIYGLDFGTTNSVVAVSKNNNVKVLPIGIDDNPTMPSVLFYSAHRKNFCIGRGAIEEYVKTGMKGRFIQSIKKVLPFSWFNGTYIDYQNYTAETLISLILGEVKARADEIVREDVKSVVIGRPAKFSDDSTKEKLAEERLLRAAKLAGFKKVRLQLEPIAAAFSYELALTKPELVLVADFGGGTSDFALVRLDPKRDAGKNRASDILAANGVHVGGDDFNSRIMWHKLTKYFGANKNWRSGNQWLPMPNHIIYTLCDWHKISSLYRDRHNREFIKRLPNLAEDKIAADRLVSLIEDNLGFSLFQAIETGKCNISEKNSTVITYRESIIDIEEPLTREEFERMLEDKYIDKFRDCIDELFVLAGIAPDEIDSMFLTGGSSFIPIIARLLETKIGRGKIRSADKFLSVAEGLAKSSYLLNK